MSSGEQAVMLWKAFAAMGVRPSISMVEAGLRVAGIKFANATVRAALRPLAEASPHPLRRASGGPIVLNRRARGGPSCARADLNGVSKLVPIVEDLTLLTSFGVDPSLFGVGSEPAKVKPKRTRSEWAGTINARVTALASREIRTLDRLEMHDFASAHALRFMPRAAGTEAKVRSLAIGLVGRIRNVVTAKEHPEMHDLTVGQYLAAGAEIYARAGGSDWDKPWSVVGWAQLPKEPVRR